MDWTRYDALQYFPSQSKEANPFYRSILELDRRLTDAEIPHIIRRLLDGWQIVYSSMESPEGDIISHFGAYGHELDLMEAMGFGLVDVKGFLTSDEAFDLIKDWDERRRTRIESSTDQHTP